MDKMAQIEELAKILDDWVDGSWDIAQAIYAAGYRKLPERPKVLTQTQSDKVWADPERKLPLDLALLQAQLEADIRHYEGKDG